MYSSAAIAARSCQRGGVNVHVNVNHHAVRSASTKKQTPPSHRGRRSSGAGHVAVAAAASCAVCSSARTATACSASTALRLRHSSTSSSSTTSGSPLLARISGPPRLGKGPVDPSVVAWNCTRHGLPGADVASSTALLQQTRAVHASSGVNPGVLPGSFHVLGPYAMGTSLQAQATLLEGPGEAAGWTSRALAAAVVLAGAATAGSLLLNPIDALRGKTAGGGGGGGSDGSGGGGPLPPVGGKKHEQSFDSPEKEREGEQLGVAAAVAARPYEVSVRALRGGRLSMEDENVVASGGRMAAVFDGHGGGGVSKHLRDRLHVVLAEELVRAEKTQHNAHGLRRFTGMFGKGRQGNQVAGDNTDVADRAGTATARYDLAHVGDLPLPTVEVALKNSFDRVEKEVLRNDEYEYQGSTAVATLLHETRDGARTLLSANIGDSRGILSRRGRAVDLTRDHKPNDPQERARILAMGEKIEWDHYCKVYRVRNLSLSRAVGDRFAKPAVSSEVEIQRFPVEDDDEFILLASDGLWDVMASQEVVSYVLRRLHAAPKDGADITCKEDMANLKYLRRKNMSRFVANEALRRGSGDNISVVIVWLNEFDHML